MAETPYQIPCENRLSKRKKKKKDSQANKLTKVVFNTKYMPLTHNIYIKEGKYLESFQNLCIDCLFLFLKPTCNIEQVRFTIYSILKLNVVVVYVFHHDNLITRVNISLLNADIHGTTVQTATRKQKTLPKIESIWVSTAN